MAYPNSTHIRATFQSPQPSHHLQLESGEGKKTKEPRLHSRAASLPEETSKKLDYAYRNYEVQLEGEKLQMHRANQAHISGLITALHRDFFLAQPDADAADFRAHVNASLEMIIRDANFDTSPYQSKINNKQEDGYLNGYGKYLLYGDENNDAPFCLQYFHFSSGQKTPIHDHPVPCISLVTRGNLHERHYTNISPGLARKTQITARSQNDRKNILDVSKPNIHSLKNKGTQAAGSVHFYYMDGGHNSRAVKTIYQKAEQGNKNSLND